MTVCEKCNKEVLIGQWPFCPHDSTEITYTVIGDECDVWIRHGICNEDGTPRHYTSRQDMAREAQKRGLVNLVEHVPEAGSDKSKHTSKWV